MSRMSIIGILLIIASAFVFSYPYFTYQKKEDVAKVGDLELSISTNRAVEIPPMVGGGLLAAGVVLLVIGFKR